MRVLRDFTLRCLMVTVTIGVLFAIVALAKDLTGFALLVGLFVVLGGLQTLTLTRRLHRLERRQP